VGCYLQIEVDVDVIGIHQRVQRFAMLALRAVDDRQEAVVGGFIHRPWLTMLGVDHQRVLTKLPRFEKLQCLQHSRFGVNDCVGEVDCEMIRYRSLEGYLTWTWASAM
jgi:hypothetical protein